jgi:hypothetical protein
MSAAAALFNLASSESDIMVIRRLSPARWGRAPKFAGAASDQGPAARTGAPVTSHESRLAASL